MEIVSRQVSKNTCCGGKGGSIALQLSKPLTIKMLAALLATGQFAENKAMTKANILYVDNKMLTAHGKFGGNRLQLTCKFTLPTKETQCQQHIATFEEMIKAL
jgi:hypothetical protein